MWLINAPALNRTLCSLPSFLLLFTASHGAASMCVWSMRKHCMNIFYIKHRALCRESIMHVGTSVAVLGCEMLLDCMCLCINNNIWPVCWILHTNQEKENVGIKKEITALTHAEIKIEKKKREVGGKRQRDKRKHPSACRTCWIMTSQSLCHLNRTRVYTVCVFCLCLLSAPSPHLFYFCHPVRKMIDLHTTHTHMYKSCPTKHTHADKTAGF